MPSPPDAETLLDTILEGIGLPFYAVDKDWRIFLYNSAAERHFGQPAEKMIGTSLWEHFPQDRPSDRSRLLHDAMARRETLRGETLSLTGRHVSYVMFPLGEGLGVFVRDVTDRRNAEKQREEAEEALRKRTLELEAVLETIPTGVWFTTDPDLRHVVGNRRAIELLRIPRELDLSSALNQPSGFTVFRDGIEVPPEARPLHRAARGETVPDVVLEIRFDNGDRRMLLMRAAPLRSKTGELQGAVAAAADVTERLRYEDHLKLLLNELNHRVKNTLAIVQSIATLTLKDVNPDARATFEERLLNLSAVHNLLTDESWDSTSLAAVARTSLRAARERVSFDGDDLRLRPKSAVALSMALHELGTNALKYGALSTEHGRISVQWTIDNDRFRLRWQETGGPPVSVPEHRGFGSRMIERGLAAELQGEVRIDWQSQGVVCTIDAPIEAIHDRGSGA
ncbi:MAG: PAS domain-containing protein [Proteobacteria bacterium]|nr:PAS domain-containing protein [Pseudomonadota bacterium]